MTRPTGLLTDEPSVRTFLREHMGLDDDDVRIDFLTGGVSSVVVRVVVGGACFVVKQALPQLRVAETWYSRPERSLIEARCAQALGRLVQGSVPEVALVVPERHAFVMRCAPQGSETWKARLMRGHTRATDAVDAGALLGRIHTASAGSAELAGQFGDRSFFRELRVDPYLRHVAMRHPDISSALDELMSELDQPGLCLVHGDYSPKNLLVKPGGGLLLVDHEVAHWGHPAFDVAFVVNHLCLKAIRFRNRAVSYTAAASALLAAYRAASSVADAATGSFAGRLLGGLLLARVDGKSPVEYLIDERDRDLVRSLGRAALRERSADPDAVVSSVARAVANA